MTAATPSTSSTAAPAPIVNISCYKFVPLDNLDERRTAIRRQAVELNLKGTVLLSHEGINLFVAGPPDAIHQFVDYLRSDPAFADLQPKESANEYQPFNRMLVKVKKEIIAFGIEGVAPAQKTSPKLPARELKKWLDEGRKVIFWILATTMNTTSARSTMPSKWGSITSANFPMESLACRRSSKTSRS